MPLSSEQLKHLERRLKEERARVLEILNRSVADYSASTETERSGNLTSVPLHMADIGTDTMREELDASNETRMSRELAEIDAALERIYQSPETFGTSEATGEQIPFDRLDVIPWART